jgi:Mrp family chromosome partitioning ATPase
VPEEILGLLVNEANTVTVVQAEIDISRQSKHWRQYRKRMQSLLRHSLLYANLKNPVIENYRNLAANIRYSNADNPIKSILMTSSAPGEGKTITASNLAIIMAQSGKKVLLVDADLRRPKIHRIFQINREPGLADLLMDEGDFVEEIDNIFNVGTTISCRQYQQNDNSPSKMESYFNNTKAFYIGEEWDSSVTISLNGFIRSTKMENLFLLPCGAHFSNPGVLFTSERIHHLIKRLSEHFDLVIFDSPPLLSTADAVDLSTEVNATLMVISSGKTKRKMGIQGKEMLENVNANVMGTVLNNVDYAKQYGSCYYYYYYSSYYYSSDNEEYE